MKSRLPCSYLPLKNSDPPVGIPHSKMSEADAIPCVVQQPLCLAHQTCLLRSNTQYGVQGNNNTSGQLKP